jgi:biopolymer transport protein TolR
MSAVARPRYDINITPLIDVMLVLLIIFMMMPFTHQTVEARVPAPPTDDPVPPPTAAIVIGVGPRLALNGKAVEGLSDLRTRLEAALLVRNDRTVFVRSHGEATYGRVVQVMDTARDAGADRLGLITAR